MAGWYCGTTREGPAISRARAAVLLTTLTFLLSAAVAQASPSFQLTDSSARAGDLVHFSISGIDGSGTYELEVDDTYVLDGTSAGPISGTFAVPDLGDAARTVTVEAKIWASGRRKNMWSDLEYLGSALPVIEPPAQAPTPAAPTAPQPAASPAPDYTPNAVDGSPASAVKTRSKHRRHSRRRRATEPLRHVARNGERRRRAHHGHHHRRRGAATRHARHKRAGRQTSRLLDGVSKPGTPPQANQHAGPGRTAPHTAVLVATGARPGKGMTAAAVVPALLGFAALVLAGTAVVRRRRLVARRGRRL